MRVSVLAWGSLVWDRQNLAVITDFEPDGPRLPVEFCRVSRDGRLTLVVDESVGKTCITYSATSAFDDLDAAIENLRLREHTNPSGVGFVVPGRPRVSATALERHPKATKAIAAWIMRRGFDAAIWTALAGNFKEKTGGQFSVASAIRYLETLNDETLNRALQYIRLAPAEVDTPVRKAVGTRWRISGVSGT